MRDAMLRRVAKAGGRLMHTEGPHELVCFRPEELEAFLDRGELAVLYRFHTLSAEARSQALHLRSTRENFVLREYMSEKEYARCYSLDEVEVALQGRTSTPPGASG